MKHLCRIIVVDCQIRSTLNGTKINIKLQSWRPSAVIWCPRSSIRIMDLPALWTIPFCTGRDSSTCGRVHVGTGIDLLAWTACWPMATVAAGLRPRGYPAGLWPVRLVLRASDVGRGQRPGEQDKNIAPSLLVACWNIKVWLRTTFKCCWIFWTINLHRVLE